MMDKIKNYLPLLVVVFIALSMSLAIEINRAQIDFSTYTNGFMGFFFCLLSMFKLFNIVGFADGFQKYDIVAMRFRPYAYLYPFIELSLGLAYLAQVQPLATNSFTLFVMTLSAIGVIRSIMKGLDLRCACLGTILNVPLSTVSVVENIGMGLMAGMNIVSLTIA